MYQLRPKALILVDVSEYALYAIEQELRETESGSGKEVVITPYLCDVSDRASVARVLAETRPDTVFHAAAYKHVPMVEANPVAGLRNNVLGTFNMASEAQRHDVARFILISTDKAVRPTNVMGASKRVAELVLQGLAEEGGPTLFAMVRFGNVLGSSGSVVPRFQKQIMNGGPVTVTHKDVTRYFMTIPEAAQLVIQAGAMAQGGEVYVLDMGSSVKIIDLAKSMIRLSGLTIRDELSPDGDIEIVEVGLRPGEKLYEELLIGDNPEPTRHERIMRAREDSLPWSNLAPRLQALASMLDSGDSRASVELLQELVPEYRTERLTGAAARSA
jgi:FlaA1/EpsC-like NDP-sugar epimerase